MSSPSQLAPSTPAAQSAASDVALFRQAIKAVYIAAYAQGQFDHANGFNTGEPLERLADMWMADHKALFDAPVDLTTLVTQLTGEADRDRGLTNV